MQKGLNLKLSPHNFRHTYATLLRRIEQKDVQMLLGHSNVSQTNKYQHHDEFRPETLAIMNEIFSLNNN